MQPVLRLVTLELRNVSKLLTSLHSLNAVKKQVKNSSCSQAHISCFYSEENGFVLLMFKLDICLENAHAFLRAGNLLV